MSFTWALGTLADDPHTIEIINDQEQISFARLDDLAKEGVPIVKGSTRLVYEGDLSSLTSVSAHHYLDGMGINLPENVANRHEMFTFKTEDGLTGYVPALTLMRAFFKPHKFVLPAVFTPVGVDLLSFVNYTESPPSLVVDDSEFLKFSQRVCARPNIHKSLFWLQISKSAKKMTQTVYQIALSNQLGLLLPQGRARIIFHGKKTEHNFYVSKAALISINIGAEDSITCKNEEIIFHAMADSRQKAAASIRGIIIPLHFNGQSAVNDEEWAVIEPMMNTTRGRQYGNFQREQLDLVLSKLATGESWKKTPKGDFSVTDLTSAFRRWTTTGKFERFLDYLNTTRGHNLPESAAQIV